jgi:hypothetical protein
MRRKHFCNADVEILGAAIPQSQCLGNIFVIAETLTLAFFLIPLTGFATAQETVSVPVRATSSQRTRSPAPRHGVQLGYAGTR